MAFIEDVKNKKVEFTVAKTDENGSPVEKKQVHIEAPLLSVLPVPNIRIDSMSINFRYEIKHTIRKEKETKGDIDLKAGAKGLLSSLLDVSLSGSVSSRSATESESNRSGTLEISLQASEAEMPEGLRKILNLLSNTITITDEKATGGK